MKGQRIKRMMGMDEHGVPFELVPDIGGMFRRVPLVDQDLDRSDPPRTKRSHPYSYDPFTIWGKPQEHKECNNSIYTDRLSEEDYNKYQRLAEKHFRNSRGQGCRPFCEYNCRGDLIEKFMQDWFDDPELKLLRVIEYCNVATGYQTWRLDLVQTLRKTK